MNAVTNSSGQSNDLAKEELVMLLTSISALTSATASPSANSGTSGVGVGARFGSGEPQAMATSTRRASGVVPLFYSSPIDKSPADVDGQRKWDASEGWRIRETEGGASS